MFLRHYKRTKEGKTHTSYALVEQLAHAHQDDARRRLRAEPGGRVKQAPRAAVRLQHTAVNRTLGLLTPQEIQVIRKRFGPTQAEFARLTGIGEATVSRWERGRILPNRAMDRYPRLLDRNQANAALLKTFASSPINEGTQTETVPGIRET